MLVGRSPYKRVLGYEKMLDEHGREMHGSWGNMIDAEDAFARMGADVMRWQYCAQPPDRNLLFGFGPGARDQAEAADLLELGRVARPLRRTSPASSRYAADLETAARRSERPLDRWLVARTHELVREAEAAYEATLTVNVIRAFEAFVDDLSNWYIRRSRRRFWGEDDDGVPRRSGTRSSSRCASISPVMPFLADHLWRNLVRGGEASVHLAGWPEVADARPRAARRDRGGARGGRARPAGALDAPG